MDFYKVKDNGKIKNETPWGFGGKNKKNGGEVDYNGYIEYIPKDEFIFSGKMIFHLTKTKEYNIRKMLEGILEGKIVADKKITLIIYSKKYLTIYINGKKYNSKSFSPDYNRYYFEIASKTFLNSNILFKTKAKKVIISFIKFPVLSGALKGHNNPAEFKLMNSFDSNSCEFTIRIHLNENLKPENFKIIEGNITLENLLYAKEYIKNMIFKKKLINKDLDIIFGIKKVFRDDNKTIKKTSLILRQEIVK